MEIFYDNSKKISYEEMYGKTNETNDNYGYDLIKNRW